MTKSCVVNQLLICIKLYSEKKGPFVPDVRFFSQHLNSGQEGSKFSSDIFHLD